MRQSLGREKRFQFMNRTPREIQLTIAKVIGDRSIIHRGRNSRESRGHEHTTERERDEGAEPHGVLDEQWQAALKHLFGLASSPREEWAHQLCTS
jgi:hypothetical protein